VNHEPTVALAALSQYQQQRLAPLLEIKDPQRRLANLIEEARHRPSLEESLRCESHRVEGCLVRVWFVAEFRAGRCLFRCDSDAVSLKAVGGLLCELYSGHAPQEILAAEKDVLEKLHILHQLAENRQRTIARLQEKIREFAKAEAAKAE
jgi:cysteine desulfuration protein SufE